MMKKISQEIMNPPNIIMPAEPLIRRALSRINTAQPGYFKDIKEVRIAPGMGGYAYVTNKPEELGVIFIDFNRIKSELGGIMSGRRQEDIEEAVIRALYNATAHEKGHIDDFEGGELPAENEARRIDNLLSTSASIHSACNIFMKLAKSIR